MIDVLERLRRALGQLPAGLLTIPRRHGAIESLDGAARALLVVRLCPATSQGQHREPERH